MQKCGVQKKCGGERKRRRSYAEVAKVIPKLFGKGLNQCLCGLQGINGWEGAWGLVVGIFAALLWAGMNAGANAEGAEGIRGRTQRAQKLRKSRKRNTKIVW